MKKITILLATLLATLCLFQSSHAATAVPDAISYQGRALTATGALIGATTPVNRTVIFRIWDHPSNSLTANLMYSEQQVVTIAEGEFSVLVGTGSAVTTSPLGYSEAAKGPTTVKISDAFGGVTRYLGVTIDDGTTAVDNEISPRQQIVSGAFALRSKVAESVDNLAITTAMLANNSVTTTQVNNAAITTNKLDVSAVTAAKIADATITSAKIAADTILAGNIAAGAVGTSEILDGTIATADIANLAVTTAKIATDTILAANIAVGAVGTSEILDATIATADIADLAVTSAKIAVDTILAANIAAGAVTSSEIADASVTGADIAAATISTTNLNFKPATGDENLRIIRGTVKSDGTISAGSGFTVLKVAAVPGLYQITFTTAFTGTPTVTATLASRLLGLSSVEVYPAATATFPATALDLLPSATGCTIGTMVVGATTGFPSGFQFIAIGPR